MVLNLIKNKILKRKMKSTSSSTTGFSLIEVLIAITIILIVGAVSVSSFLDWRSQKMMDSAVDITLSTIEEARNLTVNAYQGNQYGVYLGENDKLISFTGALYNPSDSSNKTTLLPAGKIISTSTLGTSIVFQRFTGRAGGNGEVILKDGNNESNTRTILIDNSGIVSIKK